MLIMAFAAWFYAIAASLARVRSIIIERERGAAWIAALPEVRMSDAGEAQARRARRRASAAADTDA
jgi:hypothetical protein